MCRPSVPTQGEDQAPSPAGTVVAVNRTAGRALLGGWLVLAAGCASLDADPQTLSAAPTTRATQPTVPSTTDVVASPSATTGPGTTAAGPSTTTPATTASSTSSSSTASSTTTTTTIPLPADVYDPLCARVVQPGSSLSLIADTINDPTVTAESLRAENGFANADLVDAGAVIDVCPGNLLNDLTGEERSAEPVPATSGVAAQQAKLNELFADFGLPELAVDGSSGPFTRQQLCAARMALHLPVSRAEMVPGSEEEQILMAASRESLAIPQGAATSATRWVLIDETCQIMFAGEDADRITFVFKTSTGAPDTETRKHQRVPAYRYDPALQNNGWHNSTTYPVPEDDPLNGNMYRPIYFDGGQAIHGANNVPPEPASKGCARLRVENMDALLAWLGLHDATSPTSDQGRINLSVSVQGDFVP